MNKYDTPPVILASDLRTVFETADAERFAEANIETKPARFLIFRGERMWVLRSYPLGKDHPFRSRNGAKAGMHYLSTATTADQPLIGSPLELNAYGEPDSNVEVYA